MTEMLPPYDPHIFCLLHDPALVLLHTVSDVAIALAYFAIPLMLWYCARHRRDLVFRGIVISFGCFILGCGWTHVGNAVEVWWPIYWVTGAVKIATAALSWLTVVQLWPIIPQVLNLPDLEELERARQWLLLPEPQRLEDMPATLEQLQGHLNRIIRVVEVFQPRER